MVNYLENSLINLIFYNIKINKKLVRLLGFEPRTSWSVAKRSIHLSYRRIFHFLDFINKYHKNIKILIY